MPYIGDGYLYIYSNDGSTQLGYYVMTISENGGNYAIVTDSGANIYYNSGVYMLGFTYSGNLKFLGFATEPNATEPTYTIGDKFLWAANPNVNYGQDVTNLYIVESLEGTTWYVPSGWSATKKYGKFYIDFAIETSQISQDNCIDLAIGYNVWVEQGVKDGTANNISWANNGGGGGAITTTDSFTLSIIGGTDVTNPDLIAWLSEYGKLIPTDLTGYTVTVPSGWSASSSIHGQYYLTGTVEGKSFDQVNYNGGSKPSFSFTDYKDDDSYYYVNTSSFSFTVTGGDDVSSSTFIEFLVSINATFEKTGGEEQPEIPETTEGEHGEIWYKGVLLATLTEGQTVILHTEGLKAVEDVVIKNVGEVEEEKTYELSGLWLFHNELTYLTDDNYGITEANPIGFTSNGKTFYRFTTNPSIYTNEAYSSLAYGNLYGSTQTTVQKSTTGWVSDYYKTVAFNGVWYVDKRFYDWFTANAEKSHSPIPV